jgi:hypothetical protein
MAVMEAGMDDSINGYVIEQLHKALNNPAITEETKDGLRACIDRIAEAIEGMCPTALIGPGRPVAYGPTGFRSDEILVAVGTEKNAFVFPITKTEMIRFTEEAHRRLAEAGIPDKKARACIWNELGKAIEEKNDNFKILALCLTFGPRGFPPMQRLMEMIEQQSLTPVLMALVSRSDDGEKAGGLLSIIALPPRLEDQIEQIEAEFAKRFA